MGVVVVAPDRCRIGMHSGKVVEGGKEGFDTPSSERVAPGAARVPLVGEVEPSPLEDERDRSVVPSLLFVTTTTTTAAEPRSTGNESDENETPKESVVPDTTVASASKETVVPPPLLPPSPPPPPPPKEAEQQRRQTEPQRPPSTLEMELRAIATDVPRGGDRPFWHRLELSVVV